MGSRFDDLIQKIRIAEFSDEPFKHVNIDEKDFYDLVGDAQISLSHSITNKKSFVKIKRCWLRPNTISRIDNK